MKLPVMIIAALLPGDMSYNAQVVMNVLEHIKTSNQVLKGAAKKHVRQTPQH